LIVRVGFPEAARRVQKIWRSREAHWADPSVAAGSLEALGHLAVISRLARQDLRLRLGLRGRAGT
jgi:hypothetical protein